MPSGADFLQLDPSSAPSRGLTAWLTDEMRVAILDGRLAPGAALPPTRTLACDLGVSRGVVVEAYRRLTDEGVVGARTGVGTLVAALPAAPDTREENPQPPWQAAGAPLLPVRTSSGIEFDLSPGLPDLSAFPRTEWLRAERAVLDRASTTELGYGDPRGHPRLRAELVRWLARTRGIRTSTGEIIVVAGVAQSLALLATTLRASRMTMIAVEDPGSRGARDDLAFWGMNPLAVPVDSGGMDIDALGRTAARVALLTPAHQFPTGVVLTPPRRRALLEWAARVDGFVVEDDYDAEHRYDRAPVAALHARVPERVVYTGSTSKTLAPGMRLGWLLPPRHLYDDLVAAKRASDLGNPALPQLVLATLLADGVYERHIRTVRARQRARRDATLAALRRYLPEVTVEGVAAGLHLLLTLPPGTDDDAVADRARRAGVLVHPLSWHRHLPGPPGLVLGYAATPSGRLAEAVRRLAGCVGP